MENPDSHVILSDQLSNEPISAAMRQGDEDFVFLCISTMNAPDICIYPDSEKAGTIRYGVDAIMAAVTSRVPWASVIVAS